MKPLYTFKGSKIQRYKDNVGKCIGGCVYVHRQYMEEVIPKEIIDNLQWTNFEFNTVVYNLKDKSMRLDQASRFNVDREPCAEFYVKIFRDGFVSEGTTSSIWHHKWLWVKDDYEGFDVKESYAWSKKWLGKLEEPASGSMRIWKNQLGEVGLK